MAANGYQLHILMGNLGADPKVHTTRSGQKVCNFDIAVNERNSDGTEVVTWYSIAAWNGLGDVCAQYLAKGRSVMVEGTRMTATAWPGRDGNLYTRMELTANEVKFLGNGNGNHNGGHHNGNHNGGHHNGNHNGGHHNGNRNGGHYNGNHNGGHHNGNHSSQQRQAAPQQQRQAAPQQRQAAPQQRQAAPQQRQAAPQQRQPQQRQPQQRQPQHDEWQYSVPNNPDEIPF